MMVTADDEIAFVLDCSEVQVMVAEAKSRGRFLYL
jgi:hypothetical protein